MKETLLIELHYLPNLEYFRNILDHGQIQIEACETFQKQTYRNRCEILTANKVGILTVPVINKGHGVLIREVKIDYSQKWVNVHWRAIESAYRKAPFFEFYADYFDQIIHKKHVFLFDLNIELMTLCLKLLGLNKNIEFTSFYKRETEDKIQDMRSKIHPKKDIKSNIITSNTSKSYTQVFGNNFVQNLSIVDLLFCIGPNSQKVLAGK